MRPYAASIFDDGRFEQMGANIQHGRTTTKEHVMNVANWSVRIGDLLHIRYNKRELIRGALLHDYFLYDWHDPKTWVENLHGFNHPKVASRNAREYLDVDDKTSHVISSHMWPFTPTKLPLSREAWIVCIADKVVSLKETLFERR